MDLKVKLHMDITALEEELKIQQDENAYNDRTEYYMLNRLAELRMIKTQRQVVRQGQEIIALESKHDSPELRQQIANIRQNIAAKEEENIELENLYQNFANVYPGMDDLMKVELSKIVNEYQSQGVPITMDMINQTDQYMFQNYALTQERIEKEEHKADDGGMGIGLGMENENDM